MQAAATMILKIQEKHRIPLSVMDTIIVDVQSLLDVAMSDLSDQVQCICNKLGSIRKLLGGLSPFLVSFLEFLMACTHNSSSSPVTSTS